MLQFPHISQCEELRLSLGEALVETMGCVGCRGERVQCARGASPETLPWARGLWGFRGAERWRLHHPAEFQFLGPGGVEGRQHRTAAGGAGRRGEEPHVRFGGGLREAAEGRTRPRVSRAQRTEQNVQGGWSQLTHCLGWRNPGLCAALPSLALGVPNKALTSRAQTPSDRLHVGQEYTMAASTAGNEA